MTDLQKTIALSAVIFTVCVLMAGVVFLPAFDHPIEAAPASAITTVFITMVTGVLASLGFSQISKIQTSTALANQRAENAQAQLDAMNRTPATLHTYIPPPKPPTAIS